MLAATSYRSGTTHVQPQHRTLDIPEPVMQPIPIPQIDRRHPNPPPSLIPLIVIPDLLSPERPSVLRHILTKPDIDQEIGILISRNKIRGRRSRSKSIDSGLEERASVPAAEGDGARGFGVERGPERDDAEYLAVFSIGCICELVMCVRLSGGEVPSWALGAPYARISNLLDSCQERMPCRCLAHPGLECS
jgi:hypothetical protein